MGAVFLSHEPQPLEDHLHGVHGVSAGEHEAHADQKENHVPEYRARRKPDLKVLAGERIATPGEPTMPLVAPPRASTRTNPGSRDA